jgi:hypothetical protein
MPMDWGLARDYAARGVRTAEPRETKAEWLAATDPEPMLQSLRVTVSDCNLRLFGAACCRRIPPLSEAIANRKNIP